MRESCDCWRAPLPNGNGQSVARRSSALASPSLADPLSPGTILPTRPHHKPSARTTILYGFPFMNMNDEHPIAERYPLLTLHPLPHATVQLESVVRMAMYGPVAFRCFRARDRTPL